MAITSRNYHIAPCERSEAMAPQLSGEGGIVKPAAPGCLRAPAKRVLMAWARNRTWRGRGARRRRSGGRLWGTAAPPPARFECACCVVAGLPGEHGD